MPSPQHPPTPLPLLLFLALFIGHCDGRLILPHLGVNEWKSFDTTLKAQLAPLHSALSRDVITPAEAARDFSSLLADFLGGEDVFSGGEGRERRDGRSSADISDEAFLHAKREKKQLQRLVFGRNRRVGQDLRRERDKRQREGETRGQEKSFSKNFWAFSKRAVNALVGKTEEKPTFDKTFADEWYKNRYSIPVPLAPDAVSWFPRLPEGEIGFDMRPIRPKDVKSVLSWEKASSSPGDDGIFYGHLRNLESSHHFLATLFMKTLLSSPSPLEGWGASSIVHIHKAGDVRDPSNFCPIALMSCVGKIFHQILSKRISNYLVSNGFIDSELQKAFIGKISGCQDHNLVMGEIINSAKASKKTVHIT